MTQIQISKKYGADVQMYPKKDGDITYYACYLDPNYLDRNGRPMRKRVRVGNHSEGITQAKVKSKSIELSLKAERGEILDKVPFRKEKYTLAQLAEIYFAYMRKTKLTLDDEEKNKRVETNIKNDESRFRLHLNIFSNRNPEEIDDEEIEEHTLFLRQRPLSESTVNSVLTLMLSIYNLSIKKKLITTKPVIQKITGFDNTRERFLTLIEINQLKEATANNLIIDMFVKLSLSTGGRLETIRHIKVKDINFDTNTIILNDFKSSASGSNNLRYYGYFNQSIKTQLMDFVKGKSYNDYIFAKSDNQTLFGKEYFQNHLRKIFDTLFNKGINENDRKHRIVVHSLRHTFASHLAINGTPIYKIQVLMNHATPKMTQRYAKLSPEFGIAEVNKLSFL